ncbi:MAG: flagellar assembly protein FliW [Bacteriovoracaceae bacterium]|nr:flagellar assembly protein FliW [Bacteriovoracaceae bacterium]
MKINTTRFGILEVDKKDIITFKEGLLGYEKLKKFFVVDPGDQTLILWLQSAEDKTTAFPIIEPKIFNPNYIVKLLPAELNSLELENLSDACIYTILTIPQQVTDMSANLKAPIIINNKTKMARQIVLQDNKLEVKSQMYMDLKKYIVNYSSDDSKRTMVEIKETEDLLPSTKQEIPLGNTTKIQSPTLER